jgi:hypothetical protein
MKSRSFALVAILFAFACSSKTGGDGALGPAPAGTLKCAPTTLGPTGCQCAVDTVASGACSPLSVGGASHCCASTDAAGATTACLCEEDETTSCYEEESGSCECLTWAALGAGMTSTPTCSPPASGHCCAQTDNECSCTTSACTADETEVPSCAPASVTLGCVAPAFAVTTCQ